MTDTHFVRVVLITLTLLVSGSGELSHTHAETAPKRSRQHESELPDIHDLALFTFAGLGDHFGLNRCPQRVNGLTLSSGGDAAGKHQGGSYLAALRASPDLRLVVAGFAERYLGPPFDDPSRSGERETGLTRATQEDDFYGSIYVLRRLGDSLDSWDIATTVIGPQFLGGIEIMPDSDTLLVATAGAGDHLLPLRRTPPYRVEKYRLSEMSKIPESPTRKGTHTLGTNLGMIEFSEPIASIVLDRNGRDAHILFKDPRERIGPFEPKEFNLATIDVETMTEIAARVSLPDWEEGGGLTEIPMTAQSPEGRYLVTQGGSSPNISVVDLVARKSWSVPVEGAVDVLDIAFNHSPKNHGLLALNIRTTVDGTGPTPEPWETTRSQVVIGEFHVDRLVELVRSPLYSGNMIGFSSVIEWSGDGDRVVAGIDYRFSAVPWIAKGPVVVVFSFDATTRRLAVVGEVVPCDEPVSLVDIVTANGRLSIPTPTLTPTPTQSHTPPPSRTPSPPSPSVTPTEDLSNRLIYLPVAWRTACLKRRVGIDVGLVIDTSTSMERVTAAGRRKIEAAQDASAALADAINLDSTGIAADRMAIVGFNGSAWTESPLSNSRSTTNSAILRLSDRTAEGTRLDLAVREGVLSLRDSLRSTSRKVILVVLTDGLPNGVPTPVLGGGQEETVLAETSVAKELGWDVYTIGLGSADASDPLERINSDLLRRMAGRPEWYFETPSAEDLNSIFLEISKRAVCR